MHRQHEKWLMLVGIPLFMVAYWLGNQYYKQPFTAVIASNTLFTLLMVFCQWYVYPVCQAILSEALSAVSADYPQDCTDCVFQWHGRYCYLCSSVLFSANRENLF